MRKLYKPGNTINVWGIDCDWIDVEDAHVDGYLSSGWYLSPLDFDAQPKPKRGKVSKHGNNQE